MDLAGRFSFILFRPRQAGNIGSAARALKNTGFSDLRLVTPAPSGRRAARDMAVHAIDVLGKARKFPTLEEALSGSTVALGTTCRRGPYRAEAIPIRRMAVELSRLAAQNRVAIIFGPEDHGLTNQELRLCQRLITIPTAPEYPSLNLAQAVMMVAYELMLALQPRFAAGLTHAQRLAEAGAATEMMERLKRALVQIGFLPEDNPEHIMFAIRALLGRGGLTPRDVDILNGVARQIKWFSEGGRDVLEAKRRSGRKLR